MVVMIAFWLAGCEPRSIHSTYLQMKKDMSWLSEGCSLPDEPDIIYKGTFAHMSIGCEQIQSFESWGNSLTNLLELHGWVEVRDDEKSREFCHSVTGVYLRLAHGKRSLNDTHEKNYLSMRFPSTGGICSKFRPDPYQPLSAAKTSSQTINGE